MVLYLFFTLAATAQDRLVVFGTGPNFYANKVLSSAQSLASLAEQYNVPISLLAKYNNVASSFEYRKGEEVRIPLTRDNFFQRNIYGKFQPLFHIFKAGETLAKISTRYNKLSVDTIMRWNNLQDEIVVDGKPLIIGFINNKKHCLVLQAIKPLLTIRCLIQMCTMRQNLVQRN